MAICPQGTLNLHLLEMSVYENVEKYDGYWSDASKVKNFASPRLHLSVPRTGWLNSLLA